MIEAIKTGLVYALFYCLSISKIGNIKLFESLFYRVSMSKLMREDQYAWNEQCARDQGVKIGENCKIAGGVDYSMEPYLVEIGNNCLIAGNVSFITHDAGVFLFNDGKGDIFGHFGKIKIGNNCYLGSEAVILPDVEIGDNSLVAARAVVMNSFPPNSVIIGNPAKLASNIEFYRKHKSISKNTIRSDIYGFPNDNTMSKDDKKRLLLDHFEKLSIRKPRKRSR